MDMFRYFFEISFDGSRYHGWQIQKNGISVQQVFDESLAKLFGDLVPSVGCGRTDTGVHALLFYVHVDLKDSISDLSEACNRLNSILPNDITLHRIISVDSKSHARFDATQRTYHYFIHFNKNPFIGAHSYFCRYPLKIDAMNKASKLLIGTHDFSCFSKSRTQTKTNICTVFEASWNEFENGVVFTITADRFLRNMVRAIVGSNIEIGREKKNVRWMNDVVQSKNRSKAGHSVPSHGLFLGNIEYPYIRNIKKRKKVEQWMPVLV